MRKLDARTYRIMPWKNGGGTTTEIARSPAGDSLDDFDWRISMARVATSGPFSRFVGVDRSLVVLEGNGMTLALEGGEAARLDRSSAPFAFPADVAVAATLTEGPVEDFNVMTRRSRYRHLCTRLRCDARTTLASSAELRVLVVVEGEAVAELGDAIERLYARDALLLERGASLELSPQPSAELVVVDLWPY